MATILHITTRTAWEEAQFAGNYTGDTLHSDGFIHLCQPVQLLTVAERFFKGQEGLVVMVVDSERVRSPLRYEQSDGEDFPHLYGPLNMDAVLQVVDFPLNDSGKFELPDRLHGIE